MRRLLLVSAALASACSGRGGQAGIQVEISFGLKSHAKCVVVVAKKGTIDHFSNAMPRGTKTKLYAGIVRKDDLTGTIDLKARGFLSPTCDATTFNEESTVVQATFVDGQITEDTKLFLDGKGLVDIDLDGYASTQDCNDNDDQIHPDALETCNNNLDDNCDTLIDCQQGSCRDAGSACNDGDDCTQNERCDSTGQCTGSSAVVCDMPGTCQSSPGYCDGGGCSYPVTVLAACANGMPDGGRCNRAGVCFSGELFCDDGADDDLDGVSDCADSDCMAQACDAGPCTVGATCTGISSCTGNPRTCTNAAGGCLQATGCNLLTGCIYQAAARGSACDAGSCRLDGGCGQAERGALCGNGIDDDDDLLVDCLDTNSCDGQTCNDGDGCSVGDSCLGTTCMPGGGTNLCNVAPQCQTVMGGLCVSPGGCVFQGDLAQAGDLCDAGVCHTDGTCGPGIPYKPSNVQQNNFASTTKNAALDCRLWFDTDSRVFTLDGDGGVRPDGGGGCYEPQFDSFVLNQIADGGEQVVVLAARTLFIGDSGAVLVKGTRPIVFAITGDAVINGLLQSGFAFDAPPAGGSTPTGFYGGPKPHCAAGLGTAANWSNNAAGGGGGAGFGSIGELGGKGNGGSGLFPAGGPGGQVNGTPELVPLRGGCEGGKGGTGPLNIYGGIGGYGGGAIQLTVGGRLTIGGTLGVPGRGGTGGDSDMDSRNLGGGGGGGSGGGLLIEALELLIVSGAALTANGGTGGEGDENEDMTSGQGADGPRGDLATANPTYIPDQRTNGGNGGRGATATFPAEFGGDAGPNDRNCGGGGGGGMGRVYLRALKRCSIADAGVVFSPVPATLGCP